MENLFLFAIFTTAIFILLKTLEMKYLEEEMKPLKYMVRDSVIVFASAIAAAVLRFYIKGSLIDFLNVVTENKIPNLEATQVFTGEPGF
jgi:hypothetical protein